MVKILISFLVLGVLLVIGALVVLRTNEEMVEEEEKEELFEVVNLEINPDVSFLIDEDEIVQDLILLNEDAVVAYDEVDLIDETLVDAMDIVIDQAVDLGYIDDFSDDNVLFFSTSSADDTLKDRIKERVVKRLERRNIMGEIREREISAENARERLQNRLLVLDEELTVEELAEKNLRELAQLLREKRNEIREWALEKYEVENLQELRKNLQKEVQIIRESVREKIEEINDLSAEERQNYLKENRERFEEAIMEAQAEVEETIGEARRNYRERIIFGEEASDNILREANYLLQIISQEIDERLTPVMRREIMLEIREKLTKVYDDEYLADLDTFRKNIVEDILENR